MTKEELWDLYTAKNPTFEGEGTVTMTTAGLRKLFDQTYDQAHAQGIKNGRAAQQLETKTPNIFSQLFK